jgi:hypothetical protein
VSDVFEAADQGGEEQSGDNPVETLVGEGKKFKTVEDLARGKLEADAFIEQLKEENHMAVEELKKLQGNSDDSAKVADLISAVKEAALQQAESTSTTMTDDDLSERVREILRGETAKETAERNRAAGNELVLSKVGGDIEAAKIFVAERARELGMTPAKLAELSEISPEAFAKLVGVDNTGSQSGTVALQGSNPRAMDSHVDMETIDGHHTKVYYDRLRKEMGTAKYLQDRGIQKGYLHDAMALGDRFNPN